MRKMSDTVCINAPAAKARAVLSELESLRLWSDSFTRSYCVGGRDLGANTVPGCELGGNVAV